MGRGGVLDLGEDRGYFDPAAMTVLILGATSPIARAIGASFAARGHAIYLAARDAAEAERVAADIGLRHHVEVASGAFDALDLDAHEGFVDRVEATLGPIEVAVVAMGDMGDQAEAERDFAAAKRIFDVNFTGAASLCEAVARRLAVRGRGGIVGIGSVAGDRGRASNYFYGSAKGAFALYLQGLRNRLAKEGCHVLTVKLGFVDTRMTFALDTAIPKASPEEVGEAVARAFERGEDVMYYPRFWQAIMAAVRAIPEFRFKHMSL